MGPLPESSVDMSGRPAIFPKCNLHVGSAAGWAVYPAGGSAAGRRGLFGGTRTGRRAKSRSPTLALCRIADSRNSISRTTRRATRVGRTRDRTCCRARHAADSGSARVRPPSRGASHAARSCRNRAWRDGAAAPTCRRGHHHPPRRRPRRAPGSGRPCPDRAGPARCPPPTRAP